MLVLASKPKKSYRPVQGLFFTRDVLLSHIKCAVYDLDGTLVPLVSSNVLAQRAFRLAIRGLQGDKLTAFVSAFLTLSSDFLAASKEGKKVFGDFETGTVTINPNCSSRIQVIEDLGVVFKLAFVLAGLRTDKADRLLHAARISFLAQTGALQDGFNEMLPYQVALLRRIPKIVITNSPEITAEAALKLLGIHEEFDEIFGSCRKPYGLPAVLHYIMETRGLMPSELFYTGDNYGIEIALARGMGIPSAYINSAASESMLHAFEPEEKEPVLVVARNINLVTNYLGRR